MDRKQKIMKLIIDMLTEKTGIYYEYVGADTILDAHLISLNFAIRSGTIRAELNVRGLIDVPLVLKAQYDNSAVLNDQLPVRRQIDEDLENVSAKINKLL